MEINSGKKDDRGFLFLVVDLEGGLKPAREEARRWAREDFGFNPPRSHWWWEIMKDEL